MHEGGIMLKALYPFYLANKPVVSARTLPVVDKYTGSTATLVSVADEQTVEIAIANASIAAVKMRNMPTYRRQEVLRYCADQIEKRAEELAMSLCIEAGKPIKDSRGEVVRLLDTFRIAAEEASRQYGEVFPMDISPRGHGYTGMWKRVPIGLCSFITPFNFPLNLVAHKVAPAIAVGCPFVLKPASLTPIGALIIGEILSQTDLPEGAFSILPCNHNAAKKLVIDYRIKLLSFTGSQTVGWDLKANAGKKKVSLELGGNAAVVVDDDTDLDDAVSRIVFGAFYQSGQSCVSVQRIIALHSVYDDLKMRLVDAVRKLKVGDPKDPETFIGPMITTAEAERVENCIRKAIARGANLLTGGARQGSMVEPTLLEDVPPDEDVCRREIFGPVAVMMRARTYEEALFIVNDSDYGLQAGIFTKDVSRALRAWDELEVGGVMINEVPSYRLDHMPYGGVKDSGTGREGVRFAMEEMTEIRMLGIRRR